MPDKVRLGIIGLGQQGGMYASVIAKGMVPHMVVGAICDTDPAKRDLAREQYPDVAVYQDYLDDDRQRRRRRDRHDGAALPAPGDGHRRAPGAASTRSSTNRRASTPSRSRRSSPPQKRHRS